MKEYTRQQNMMKQKSDIQMAIEEYKEFERVPNTPGIIPNRKRSRDSLSSDVQSQGMNRKLSQNTLSFKGDL